MSRLQPERGGTGRRLPRRRMIPPGGRRPATGVLLVLGATCALGLVGQPTGPRSIQAEESRGPQPGATSPSTNPAPRPPATTRDSRSSATRTTERRRGDRAPAIAPIRIQPGHLLVLPAAGGESRSVPYLDIDGLPHLAATDVGGILRATSFWRAETRKLLLRVGERRIRLGVDNPFVIIDEQPHRLANPPRYRQGRVWVPLQFFEFAAQVGLLDDARWDPDNRILALGTHIYSVGAISLEEEGDLTRLTIRTSEGLRPQVISASQQLFVVRLRRGVAPRGILGTTHALGRFERVEVVQGEEGVDLYMKVATGSRGYALRAPGSPSRIEILVADRWGRHGDLVFQPFEFEVELEENLPGEASIPAVEPQAGRSRRVVIDPGHGGEDPGSQIGDGQLEKHLNLEIARRLKRHLEAQGNLRVTLVRDRDERVDVPRRVEIANGLRADLFISVHCDLNGPLAGGGYAAIVRGGGDGQLLYEDLSPFVPGTITATDAAEVLSLVRWESVGTQHAVASLQLANSVSEEIQARFPAARGTVSRRPVWSLEGARMPAMLLEIGVLEGWQDGDAGARAGRASYLDAVAAAVAAGIRRALEPPVYGAAEGRQGGTDGESF